MNKEQGTMKKKLIIITGPTASGKTDLAKKLVKKYNGEVISADSRQVYLGMDIGTGKDKSFKQHLIDVITPDKQFTMADFQKMARKFIQDIYERNKVPFLVGGTGLYIDALVYGFAIPHGTQDKKLRTKLEKKTNKELLKELQGLDPKTAKIVDKNNKRRLIRSLEVCFLTGKPFSSFKKAEKPDYEVLYLAINLPRKKLYQLIDERVDSRIKQGMIEEVENLLKKYQASRLKEFGLEYRFITEYLEGKFEKNEMIEKLKFAIHSYARRQLTWFRKNKDIRWIPSQKEADKLIKDFLNK